MAPSPSEPLGEQWDTVPFTTPNPPKLTSHTPLVSKLLFLVTLSRLKVSCSLLSEIPILSSSLNQRLSTETLKIWSQMATTLSL